MKFLYHFVLAALLLGCLAAGAVTAVWKWAPEWIDAVDDKIRWRYEQGPKDELERLKELAGKDPKAALPKIQALSEEFRVFKAHDRRTPTGRAADRLLMSTLLTLGRTEEGLEQARQLANIDPVDHTTRRWVADQFLAAKEPFAQEGIDQLSVLFDQFPEDLKLAKQLSAALARRGDDRASLEILLRHLQAIPNVDAGYERASGPWHITTATAKEDFPPEQARVMTRVDSPHQLTLSATIPAKARFVRIAPPSWLNASFGTPVYSIRVGKKRISFGQLVDLPHETEGLRLEGRGLDFDASKNPAITFNLPDLPNEESSAESEEPLLVIVIKKHRFPSWMEASLVSDSAAGRVAEIQSEASSSLRARFFAERVRLTRAYGMTAEGPFFRIRGRDPVRIPAKIRARLGELPGRQAAADAVTFAGEITLPSDMPAEENGLEIVLPAVKGMVVKLEQVDWVSPEGKRMAASDVSAVDPTQLVAVEGSSSRSWRVLHGGTPPILKVARPQGAGHTCELRGALR